MKKITIQEASQLTGLTEEKLKEIMKFSDGLFITECRMLDSTYMGERFVIPYGPKNTFEKPPTVPFSPRGLASDTSIVIAFVEREK